jgi:hypothetical protein
MYVSALDSSGWQGFRRHRSASTRRQQEDAGMHATLQSSSNIMCPTAVCLPLQAIGLLDDLDKELNTYAMRVREWYGWHFPEMTKIVADNIAYAKAVSHRLRVCAHTRVQCLVLLPVCWES